MAAVRSAHALLFAVLLLLGLSAAEARPQLAKRHTSTYNYLQNGVGKMTFWTESGDSNGQCLLDPPANQMAVALATDGLDNFGKNLASMCGVCIRIHNGDKSVVAHVINKLPDADRGPGDLDVTGPVWRALTTIPPGQLFDIKWEVVDCPDVSGPLVYKWKDGSSQYWAGIEIRNHKKPVVSVSVNGIKAPRKMFNYFVSDSGFGSGPFTVVTQLSDGSTITDYNVPLRSGAEVQGSASQGAGSSQPQPQPQPQPRPQPTAGPAPAPTSGAPAPAPTGGSPAPAPTGGAPAPAPTGGAPGPAPTGGAPQPAPTAAPTSTPTLTHLPGGVCKLRTTSTVTVTVTVA
ncbi:hypothetical protein GGF31_002015 [Allomyces arbusculus]|nr:hypothetical protein GGF31_002015 [Allomyces arbusculus]